MNYVLHSIIYCFHERWVSIVRKSANSSILTHQEFITTRSCWVRSRIFFCGKHRRKADCSLRLTAFISIRNCFAKRKLSTESLVSENLKRLNFIQSRSQSQSAQEQYQNQLEKLLEQYKEDPVSGEVAYYLASLYHTQGTSVSDPTHPAYCSWKTADSICQVYIDKFPNSLGARNCKSLSETIRQRSWNMVAEKHMLPEKPFRFLFQYRNVGSPEADKWPVHIRVAKIDPHEYRKNARKNYGEKLIKWLKSNSETVSEKSLQVPNPGDFRQHSIELPMQGLPLGTYVIFAGSDEKLATNKDVVSYAIISVTDMALISRTSDANGQVRLKVVSRDSGKSIPQARIELLSLVYNRKARSNEYKVEATLTTDENGEALERAVSKLSWIHGRCVPQRR